MGQAAVLDGQLLDLLSPFYDGCMASEVGVGGCDVFQALVVTVIVVMIDEGTDLVFEIARQIIVLQQDAVLQRLMPTLDLALRLRMVWSAANVIDFLLLQPFGQITGDVGRAVIAKQTGFVNDLGMVATRCLQRQLQRVGNVFRLHGGAELPGDDVPGIVIEDR